MPTALRLGSIKLFFFVNIDILVLDATPKPSDKDVVVSPPRWSMLILEPASRKICVYFGLVKWLPWSLFMISGKSLAARVKHEVNRKDIFKMDGEYRTTEAEVKTFRWAISTIHKTKGKTCRAFRRNMIQ